MTSAAILGLHDSKKYQNNLKRGVAYLLLIQDADGAIHVNESSLMTTTAYAAIALGSINAYKSNGLVNAVRYLIRVQNEDGGWGWVPQRKEDPTGYSKSNPNATAYVCFALTNFLKAYFSVQESFKADF